LNFSFPFRPVVSERPTPQRLLPLLFLAVGVNALLLLWPVQRPVAPGRAGRVPAPADDTPELLRLSRAAESPARLSSVPFTALPPPPPSLLPKGSLAQVPVTAVLNPALPAPSLPPRLAEAVPALLTLLRQLPAVAVAGGDRGALVALQRRQWWLTAAQEPLAVALWQRAALVPAPPEVLGRLPEDAELRRLPPGPVSELGAGDWHGHSLVTRQAALLLWRQAGGLWLLRLPLPAQEPVSKTLTSS
jgi:hypothetical protein